MVSILAGVNKDTHRSILDSWTTIFGNGFAWYCRLLTGEMLQDTATVRASLIPCPLQTQLLLLCPLHVKYVANYPLDPKILCLDNYKESGCSCGPLKDWNTTNQESSIMANPWIAQIYKVDINDQRRLKCLGTLISQRHVLTSKYCFGDYHYDSGVNIPYSNIPIAHRKWVQEGSTF